MHLAGCAEFISELWNRPTLSGLGTIFETVPSPDKVGRFHNSLGTVSKIFWIAHSKARL